MVSADFEFSVSAGATEVFGWLHGRAAKSGHVISRSEGDRRFRVNWPARTVGGTETAVTMAFAVRAVGEHRSLVTVEVRDAASPLEVIRAFAGPLGTRMTGLRARPRAFFDPPLSRRHEIVMSACLSSFVILLTVIVSTRQIPAEGDQLSGREFLREFVAPLVVAGFAAGVGAGIVAHRRSRWFELPVLGLLFGWSASFLVFWFWFISIDSGPGAGSGSSNFALAIGAGLCAAVEALIVLVGISVGRIPAALAWSFRRLRGRRPAVRSA